MRSKLILAGLLCAAITEATAQLPTYVPRGKTEVLWDSFGVPHVYGSDARSLMYAFGWAQMQSHGDLMLRLYGQARGRGAEYWGETLLDADRWMHLNDVPARADLWYRAMRPDYRAMVEAFVAGINAYAAANPARLDDRFEVVLPVRPQDVMAHMQRVVNYTFIASPQEQMGAARAWGGTPGSNAWAVAPKRSASGNALLLANPHLPWADLFTWYEAHLVGGGINAYGAALIGFPTLSIAFNQSLGWTHTVNTYDGADLYELQLVEGGYLYDGKPRPFETSEQEIRVRGRDGTISTQKLQILRSIHGPVISQSGNRALALRVAGLDAPHVLEQYWRMLKSKNLGEFERALRMLQMPMFTVMYADRRGHIMHLFNGRVPKRPRGNVRDWRGIMRGDSSATLWTAVHSYSDLPRLADPETGWLQNANDPPWTTTFPLALDAARYPEYMAPNSALGFRPQRSARLMMSDSSITFEEMIAYKHSTRLEAADHLIDPMKVAVEQHGTERGRRAMRVLTAWDRSADAESRGAVLFQALMREVGRRRWPGNSPFAVRWNAGRPLETPSGLSDAEQIAEALDVAAGEVERTFTRLDVAWGEVNRLRIDAVDLPGNGAGGELGAFRVIGYQAGEDGRAVATGGDSYVAVIEFGKTVRAMTLISYGNASQPGSPHRTDQLPLLSRKQLKPVWLSREDIEKHLEGRLRLDRKK